MQRALRNTLMTENGRKLDNELTTTLFENITTLAQLQHRRSRVFAKSLTTYRDFSLCRSSTQRALNICPPAAIAACRLHLSTTPLSLHLLISTILDA